MWHHMVASDSVDLLSALLTVDKHSLNYESKVSKQYQPFLGNVVTLKLQILLSRCCWCT